MTDSLHDRGVVPLTEELVSLPKRKRDTHKGDYGRVMIAGGCDGYTGAPNLSAAAAEYRRRIDLDEKQIYT